MTGTRGFGGAAFVAAMLALGGCGGGGGGDDDPGGQPAPPPPVEAKAEGVYVGTSGEQRDVGIAVFVLENDEFWAVYQFEGTLSGFLQGTGTSFNGSYTVEDLREYNFYGGGVSRHSLSADYRSRESLSGTVTAREENTSYPFTGSPPPPANYDYDKPASLTAIAGVWDGSYGNRSVTGPINFSAEGAISATTSRGCSFTGNAAPRRSGKNVYDVAIVQGSAPCELPGQAMTGIAFINVLPSGDDQLVVMLVDASRELGVTFIAER